MLVAIQRRSGVGPGENAQCSGPALTRGNTRGLFLHKKTGGVAFTVFGAAFDRRIASVHVVMLNGNVRALPFVRPRPDPRGSNVAEYRYVAVAVDGPWCVSELVTRDRAGDVMWRTNDVVSYSPEFQCSRERKS